MLAEKGYTTSLELKEKYGVAKLTGETVWRLSEYIEGLRAFTLYYTSTYRYTVLPPRFNRTVILYVRGREADVVGFLRSIIPESVPPYIVRRLLKINGAPREVYTLF